METKHILMGGAGALLLIGGITTGALISKGKETPTTQQAVVMESTPEDTGFFSEKKKKDSPLVNLVTIADPLGQGETIARFTAPQDDLLGSITSVQELNVPSGQLELSNNFLGDVFDASEMSEGSHMAFQEIYTFYNDGMITWDNLAPDNEHHKWEEHPEFIPVKRGSKAIVTYTYDPSTADWTASIKVMG